MKTGVWAQALVLTVVSLAQTGFCKERELSLQKYEKTEGSMLVCATCSSHATGGHARRRKNVEWCASKCKKNKKFKCRAFNFEKLKRTGKCHLLCCDRFAPGAQIQANANFTLYERKDYIRECIVGTGQYRGRRSWTKSNITCQAWSDSSIHDHTFYPDRYPKRDLRENFCRNPTPGKPGGPWCYTTDPNIRVEECGIPKCSEEVCMTCNGEDYRGRVDETESGRECRRWDSLSHPFQGRRYRDKDLKDNYCRNPNNQLRPWCYTMETDKTLPWEYCNISVCDPPEVPSVNITTSCVRRKAADYRGKVNTTPKGVSCQRWDSQFPHNHTYHPQNYKCRDLKENYCRNPDGSDYPWCFTMDPKQRRANCTHIPRCDAGVPQKTECYKDNGEAYQGTLSMTRSGIPCGNWSHHINSRDPHSAASHVLLEKNYCRNPDRDKHGPWCYTNSNSRLTWDYCELKKCESPQISAPLSNLTTPTISCIVHINTRIVGGHRVHGSDGSWVVSIQRENNHLCGGTLVREDWVLTDQQCFTSCVPDLKDYSVQVGLRHLNASSNHPRLHISRLICGPEGSNLVLLKLEKPAPVSEGATSIHLPVRECHIREGTNCTMYGWGETKNTGHEESLKAVTMPMVNNEVCSRLKDGAGDSRVCAGGKRGEGVCDKDNGGPLVCQEHERKVIIGVSVQRTKCASSQPALFVNVAFYSEWIYKVFKLYPS